MPEEQVQAQSAPAQSAELSEFESLMTKEFKPKSAEAKSAVKMAVQTLAEQAVAASTLISDNAIKTIEAIIAEIDRDKGLRDAGRAVPRSLDAPPEPQPTATSAALVSASPYISRLRMPASMPERVISFSRPPVLLLR